MKRTYPKVSECQVLLRLPARDLAALDAYCAGRRRETGDPVPRAAVVREAIRRLVERGVGEGGRSTQ